MIESHYSSVYLKLVFSYTVRLKKGHKRDNHIELPVKVEGSYFCIVSLKVNKIEKIFWSLLISFLSKRKGRVTNHKDSKQ